MILDSLFEFLFISFKQTKVDFNEYKYLRPLHQPWVNSYFGLTTVKMPVAPLRR